MAAASCAEVTETVTSRSARQGARHLASAEVEPRGDDQQRHGGAGQGQEQVRAAISIGVRPRGERMRRSARCSSSDLAVASRVQRREALAREGVHVRACGDEHVHHLVARGQVIGIVPDALGRPVRAPRRVRRPATSGWASMAAKCSGVISPSARAFGSAPRSRSNLAAVACPEIAARCRGVSPRSSRPRPRRRTAAAPARPRGRRSRRQGAAA